MNGCFTIVARNPLAVAEVLLMVGSIEKMAP